MTKKSSTKARVAIKGSYAVLGMDIVSFSKLTEDDQQQAVQHLFTWIRQSLAFNNVEEGDFTWSHAGDGGYLTFTSIQAGTKAIDVAFDIVRRARGDYLARGGRRLNIRMGLHEGFVQETPTRSPGFWREVSGIGINMTARILSISSANQLLVSRQYYEAYVKNHRAEEFDIGPLHTRSVKHGAKIEVMNVNRDNLCLDSDDAAAFQWQAISGLWEQTIHEYENLIHDSLKGSAPLAAVAAATYLLTLGKEEPVKRLCRALSAEADTKAFNFPVQRHELFGALTTGALMKVISIAKPRLMSVGEILCRVGDAAESCFYVVSGRLLIDRPLAKEDLFVGWGELVGEFAVWINGLRRTADLKCTARSLVIEIPIPSFRRILEECGKAETIIARIREKVIDNVFSSTQFFPPGAPLGDLAATCGSHPAGSVLDLSQTCYFLFNGSVFIEPVAGKRRTIAANGRTTPDALVGLISPLGCPDGETATVLTETVAVAVSHGNLRRMQNDKVVARLWNALYGIRIGDLNGNGDDDNPA